MRIKEVIKNIPLLSRVNGEIKKHKYIHLMYNDKFTKPYIDFLKSNFNTDEHLFLWKRWIKDSKVAPFPEGDNVIEIFSLAGLNLSAENIEKIYCHTLFDKEIINYLYSHDKQLKEKAYWIIWGGDLYNAPDNEKNNYVRKHIRGYISSAKGDETFAKEKYGSNPELYNAPYWGDPMTPFIVKSSQNPEKPDCIRIQINNSCDKTTLEMLDILSKFKDENIRIVTPLSYGRMEYKEEIIKKGRGIFGDKFEYINDFMAPEEYLKNLSQNHIFILFQNRQQGGGNAAAALYYGAKVYVRKEVITYKNLMFHGAVPYDANLIKDMSFREFAEYREEDKIKSQKSMTEFYSAKIAIKSWTEVFAGRPNI